MSKPLLKYIVALLLFGSNGIIASMIDLSSYEIVMFRTLIGSMLLVTLYLLTEKHFCFYEHKKSAMFLTLSGISMGVSWLFLYEAYRQIGVSIASLGYYCGPVIVMAISPFFFKEHFTKQKTICFLTCCHPESDSHQTIIQESDIEKQDQILSFSITKNEANPGGSARVGRSVYFC